MSSQVLILTLSFGTGHVSAACSVAEAWQEKTGQKAVVWDAIPHFPWWFRLIYVSPYWWMIRRWPSAWRKIAQARLVNDHPQTVPHSILQLGARSLLYEISKMRPSTIVATEVGACEISSLYKTTLDGSVSLAALVTDFELDPIWNQPGIDLYLVPSNKVASRLRERGLDSSKIGVVGIPVRVAFQHPLQQPRARRVLGLSPDRPVILMMAGGMGPCHLDRVIVELERLSESRLQLIALAGRDKKLLARLRALKFHRVDLIVRGWTDNVAHYMAAADVMITKPGALTLSEAQAVGLPTVAFDPLPFLEEANLRELVHSGAGVAAENPLQAAQLALTLLRKGRQRKPPLSPSLSSAMEIIRHLERFTCETAGTAAQS
jgi:processive 1,2-diacylglycerol beta-glucosyltransferase